MTIVQHETAINYFQSTSRPKGLVRQSRGRKNVTSKEDDAHICAQSDIMPVQVLNGVSEAHQRIVLRHIQEGTASIRKNQKLIKLNTQLNPCVGVIHRRSKDSI